MAHEPARPPPGYDSGGFSCSVCRVAFIVDGFNVYHSLRDAERTLGLLEMLHRDDADICAMVTGDTDIIPAIRTAGSLFRGAQVFVFFPYQRKNGELEKESDRSFQIKAARYSAHQLPDPVLGQRTPIRKPSTW